MRREIYSPVIPGRLRSKRARNPEANKRFYYALFFFFDGAFFCCMYDRNTAFMRR
jgi:hypothetical protein